MAVKIAHTAVIDPKAKIGKDVQIGHFAVIGPDVEIGDGCQIDGHVQITGVTSIGENNHIYPGAIIGTDPQDTSYQNTPTRVVIGDGNIIRENCTINRGTEKEEGVTRVGDNNFLMINTHIGHDCIVGDRIVMANNVMLGGHARIGNDCTLAGGAGVSQFGTVGQLSFVSAMSKVLFDVPPFTIVEGHPAKPRSVNIVGLRRHDYSREDIRVLTKAFKLLYRQEVGIDQARQQMFENGPIRPVLVHWFEAIANTQQGRNGRGHHLKKGKKAA